MINTVKITIQNSCQKYTHKYVFNDSVVMDLEDPRMKDLISRALALMIIDEEAKEESVDIDVKISSKLQ